MRRKELRGDNGKFRRPFLPMPAARVIMHPNRETTMTRKLANLRSASARAAGRYRAFRHDDRTWQIESRMFLLGLGASAFGESKRDPRFRRRVAAALRRERRAARNGAAYDPLRHLLLLRLARKLCQAANGSVSAGPVEVKPPLRSSPRKRGPRTTVECCPGFPLARE